MTPRQQLDALINQFGPRIRNAFLVAIQDIVDEALLIELITAIQNNDAERAFAVLNMSDASLRPLVVQLEAAFEAGGVYTGKTFPKYLNTTNGRAVFRFDVRNERAEKWLREHSSSLITGIQDDARTIVRNALTDGMERGLNPRNVALDIVGRVATDGSRMGGAIGLTPNQDGWVRSARNKLQRLDESYFTLELRDKRFDPTVAKAIREGRALDSDTIEKLITRYKSNALKYRGEMIGRTEAIQSLNQAEYEATRQAVDSGATSESAVKREWDSAGDKRVRPTHVKMNGQRVGMLEPFVSPSGARMMFPGDTSLGAPASEVVACRCRVRTVIDWAADLD